MSNRLYVIGTITVVVGIYLLAIRPDETPPHWEDVCVSEVFSHNYPLMVWTGKSFVTVQRPIYKCVETERQCLVGEDYKGEKVCL